VRVHRFPDGESLVRVRPTPGDRAILVRSLHDPNAKLVEMMLAADALRRAGARHLTLVAPYLPYMRQDIVFHAGESLSQQVIGQLLGRCFDRVVAVEPHLHRIATLGEAFPCDAIAISAAPAFAAWLERMRTPPLLVGPDEESEPWLRAIAALTGLPFAVGRKVREGDTRVKVEFSRPLPPDSASAVIIDDIASSGATAAQTARALRRAGVRQIDVAVVHAIFSPGAVERMRRAGVRRIVSCETVPHETNALRVVDCVARVLVPQALASEAAAPGALAPVLANGACALELPPASLGSRAL